jgi:hypothetical protein
MQTPFPGLFYRIHSRSERVQQKVQRPEQGGRHLKPQPHPSDGEGFPMSALVLGGLDMVSDCDENLPVGSRANVLAVCIF